MQQDVIHTSFVFNSMPFSSMIGAWLVPTAEIRCFHDADWLLWVFLLYFIRTRDSDRVTCYVIFCSNTHSHHNFSHIHRSARCHVSNVTTSVPLLHLVAGTGNQLLFVLWLADWFQTFKTSVLSNLYAWNSTDISLIQLFLTLNDKFPFVIVSILQ